MKRLLEKYLTAEQWDRFAGILFLIYFAECAVGCSGRWLEFGPISIRMVLFILCFAASLPAVFRNLRKLSRNLQVILIALFGLYWLVCLGIGLRTGNRMSFIWADVNSVLALALIPGFLSVMCSSRAIERTISVLFWSAVTLAVITVMLHFIIAFLHPSTVTQMNDWINHHSLGGFAKLQTGIQRIYFRSQFFFQTGILFGILKIQQTRGKKRFALYLCEGILFCGCILSYTRGFWLGLAASILLLALLGVRFWKDILKACAAMLAVFVVFFGISWVCYGAPAMAVEIVNRFDPDLIVMEPIEVDPSEATGDPNTNGNDSTWLDGVDLINQQAAALRGKTLYYLQKQIGNRPVFGNGLGENLDEIRNDGKTEYMYLDILMKTGAVGLVLFLMTFFGFLPVQIRNELLKKNKTPLSWDSPVIRNRVLTAAYLGVALTSFFNPFLLNPMGIALLMLTSSAVFCE